jgi:predicted dehydrogenase
MVSPKPLTEPTLRLSQQRQQVPRIAPVGFGAPELETRKLPGIGLIGAGRWGPNLARNFAADPEWDLRWVCDLDCRQSDHLASTYDARATTALERVLDDPAVSTVAIATPATTHAELVAGCLAAGRHVLVEKPLACTVLDAVTLIETARARGVVLLCDHTYRFTQAAQAIQRVIAEGVLGELVGFASVRTNAQCGHSDVDVFWDLAHHDLSLLDAFFGDLEPEDVSAVVAASTDDGRAVTGTLSLAFPFGAGARIDVDWDAPAKCRVMEVAGTRGTLRWDDLALEPLTATAGVSVSAVAPLAGPPEPLQAVVGELLEVVRGERAPRCGTDVDLRVLATLERATAFAAGGA